MKICMIVDTNFIEDRRVRKEAKILMDAGYKVTVIAFRDWIGMGAKIAEERIQFLDGIKIIYIDSKKAKIKFGPLRFLMNFYETRINNARQIIKYAIGEKADIYHSNDLDTLLEGVIAAKVNKSKLIYDSHEFFTEIIIPGFNSTLIYSLYWKIVERLLISHVDGVMTVCLSIAKEFTKRYGIKRPIVVHNCAELQPFRKLDLIRQNLNIPPEKKVVLSLGSMFPGRGFEIIIDSAAYIGNDAVLVLIGPATLNYREQLQQRANALKASSNADVIIANPIPPNQVYEYLMSADVGIIFYEDISFNNNGLPNKLFDYMIAGLPIVASAMSEIKSVVDETGSGIVLKNADAKQLGTAISRLVHNEAILQQFRENALKAAKEKYNWTVESQKLLKLYRDVLNPK